MDAGPTQTNLNAVLSGLDWNFSNQGVYFKMRRLAKISVGILIGQILLGYCLPLIFKEQLRAIGADNGEVIADDAAEVLKVND